MKLKDIQELYLNTNVELEDIEEKLDEEIEDLLARTSLKK